MPDRAEIESLRPPPQAREHLRQLRIHGRRITQKALAWRMVWTVGLAVLAAVLGGLVPQFGLEVTFPRGLGGAIGHGLGAIVFGAIVIGTLRLIAHPLLRRWEDQPVRIWAIDRYHIVQTPFSQRFVIPIYLENRSEIATYQCSLNVLNVSGKPQFDVPRLVDTAVVPPNGNLPIDFVYWDRRNPPLGDGDRLFIVSPPAPFAEGMLAPLPLDPHQIELEAWVQGKKPYRIVCRVWVDETRTLRLKEVAPGG